MGSDHGHWQQVYTDKAVDEVSWFQPSPAPSLEALDRLGATADRSLIDVGGGTSNLVDALLDRGWSDLTVLDISSAALEAAKQRLASDEAKVEWLFADITSWSPLRTYDIWHDRAVFHFLTDSGDREAYRRRLLQALAPGGAVVMATFSLSGPERCSGLPVQRYDAEGLARELGPDFVVVDHWGEDHVTPWGSPQSFTWCLFRRGAGAEPRQPER